MFDEIFKAWEEEMSLTIKTPWFERLEKGDVGLCHYKGYLRESYHHAGLNPQIQAYATMFFKDNPRDMISLFYNHARQEIAHDLLALNDLKSLGVDVESVKISQPLPSTIALNAFPLFMIQFRNPVSYLGYLFHLEFLPTQGGEKYMRTLIKAGIPKGALTFIEEHSTLDIAHNNMMQKYIENLIKTKEDLADVIYAVRTTSVLHGKMVSDAMANGEKIYPT